MKWGNYRLGRLLTLEYGAALPEAARSKDGSVLVAGSNGVVGHHDESLVPGPGIVVGRKGSAGRVTWLDSSFWPIDTTYYVVPKPGIELRWLYYLLTKARLDRLLVTTGVPGLNRNDVYSLEASVPSPSEQRRIVEILDQADGLRSKRIESDVLLGRIPRALFLNMFGDPLTNPHGWPVDRLGNSEIGVLDRGRSQHRPCNAFHLYGGPYPFVQTGDVANSDGVIRRYTQTYSDAGLAQSRLWPVGTLCITIAANIAKTGVLSFEACFPDSVVGFVPGKLVTTEYVQTWLTFVERRLEELAPQMAQKNINLETLRGLSIPTPPIEIQKDFGRRISGIREARQAAEKSGVKVSVLFETLMNQAIDGRLTAKWREGRTKELLAEMEHQARVLEAGRLQPT